MNLSDNNPITADGTYVVDNITPGRQYLCALAGSFGGGTLAVKRKDSITGDVRDMTSGSFTAAEEFTVIIPGDELQFVLSGSTAPSISVELTPIENQ